MTRNNNELIEASERKIESLKESLAGYPGLVIRDHIKHQISISKAVIRRLKK